MKKLISVLLAAIMLLVNTAVVIADKNDMTSKLYLSDIGYPSTVMHYVNGDSYKSINGGPVVYGEGHTDKYNTSGTLLTYGYWQSPVALTNDVFPQAIPYMCYGVENSTTYSNNDNQIRVKLDTPVEVEENDGVYVSFYYRAADKFYGVGDKASTQYTGQTTQFDVIAVDNSNPSKQEQYTNKWQTAVCMFGDTQTTAGNDANNTNGSLGRPEVTVVPDGKWHRVEGYVWMDATKLSYMGDTNKLSLAFNMNRIFESSYIELAGFRTGVLKTADLETKNESNQVFTEIPWHLQKSAVTGLKVNGEALDLTSGATEFTVPGTMDEPTVELTSDSGVQYDIEKLAYNRYKITTYAGAYDIAKTADETLQYRARYNNGSYSGNYSWSTFKNSDFIGTTYYINIGIKDNFKMYPLSTDWDQVVHGCENSLRNTWATYTTYQRSPEEWDNETTFTSGYTLNMLKPENPQTTPGNGSFNVIQAKFDLGDDTIETGDVVYYHFYIKSDALIRFTPTLLGKDAKNSTEETTMTIGRNGCLAGGRKYANNEIKFATTNYYVNPDYTNQWTKFVGFYRVTEDCRIEDYVQLALYFNWFGNNDYVAANVKLTDFNCGVLRDFTPISTQYAGDEINTALTAAITESINVYDFIVDGDSFETEGGTTVVADSSRPAPSIDMTAYHGSLPMEITKETAGNALPAEYTVKVYTPAYDRTLASNATLSYGLYNRPVTDNGDGTFTRTYSDISNRVNSEFVKTYSIMVGKSDDYSDYVFEIDDTKVTDFSNLKGSIATFGARFDKFSGETGYTMIMASYDADNKLVSVTPVSYTYSDSDTDSYTEASVLASADENLRFKVFVWNSANDMVPITDIININTNGIN